MNRLVWVRSILGVFILVVSQAAVAVESIDWETLVPPVDTSKDIFQQLPEPMKKSAYDLWRAKQRQANGGMIEAWIEMERRSAESLNNNGFDADEILQAMYDFAALVEANGAKLVTGLNGKNIKMPGYVLPIEFSGDKVVEFLLVPYVGACVHTPPPPANQLVHVKVDEGFESDGLFMPVWVTGQMTTAMSTQAITFEDGAANVEAGYRIDASKVIPYE